MAIGIKPPIKAHKQVVANNLVVQVVEAVVVRLITSTKLKNQMVRQVSPYIVSKAIMSQHSPQIHITQ